MNNTNDYKLPSYDDNCDGWEKMLADIILGGHPMPMDDINERLENIHRGHMRLKNLQGEGFSLMEAMSILNREMLGREGR